MFEMSDRESYQVTGDRGKRRRQLGGKDLEKAAGGSMREKAWYRVLANWHLGLGRVQNPLLADAPGAQLEEQHAFQSRMCLHTHYRSKAGSEIQLIPVLGHPLTQHMVLSKQTPN